MLNGIFGRKRKFDSHQRKGMESVLESVLHPIVPRPQFVDGLRKGLMDYDMYVETDARAINQQNAILIFAGFFSVALLLSIFIRILMMFISTIGIINYQKRRTQQNRITQALKSAS